MQPTYYRPNIPVTQQQRGPLLRQTPLNRQDVNTTYRDDGVPAPQEQRGPLLRQTPLTRQDVTSAYRDDGVAVMQAIADNIELYNALFGNVITAISDLIQHVDLTNRQALDAYLNDKCQIIGAACNIGNVNGYFLPAAWGTYGIRLAAGADRHLISKFFDSLLLSLFSPKYNNGITFTLDAPQRTTFTLFKNDTCFEVFCKFAYLQEPVHVVTISLKLILSGDSNAPLPNPLPPAPWMPHQHAYVPPHLANPYPMGYNNNPHGAYYHAGDIPLLAPAFPPLDQQMLRALKAPTITPFQPRLSQPQTIDQNMDFETAEPIVKREPIRAFQAPPFTLFQSQINQPQAPDQNIDFEIEPAMEPLVKIEPITNHPSAQSMTMPVLEVPVKQEPIHSSDQRGRVETLLKTKPWNPFASDDPSSHSDSEQHFNIGTQRLFLDTSDNEQHAKWVESGDYEMT